MTHGNGSFLWGKMRVSLSVNFLMLRSDFRFAERCVILKAYDQRRSTASERVCRVFVCRLCEEVCVSLYGVLRGLVATASSLIVDVHS